MTEPDFSNPRQSLGTLIGRTSRHWRRAVDYRLRPFGLTEATWLPLLYLSRCKAPLCQKNLAIAVGIDSSTLVRLIDALVQAGLVERKADGDRRMKILSLTPHGCTVVKQVEEVVGGLRREILGGIDDQELETTRNVIERVLGALVKTCPPDSADEEPRK
ncbi:MAG: MarR family winged helix-turn-helix transcriptional regulator [Chthoniobacteraceae bacterium]